MTVIRVLKVGDNLYGVYIIDDEKLMVENIISSISWAENGFEVIGHNIHPQKAVLEILALKPHLVFCDLKMPDMDGIELIKKIRDAELDCEFIMLSAFGEFEASRSFYRLNGFDYLLKPLKQQEAELVLERLSREISAKEHMTPSTVFKQSNTKAFDELIAYITENISKKYTLEKLSKQFGISQSHICRLFSKYYQSTLTIFLTNLRMKEAGRLIAQTDMAFKEIALDCGYPDYFYFYRVFKGYWGISPTDYRQINGVPHIEK